MTEGFPCYPQKYDHAKIKTTCKRDWMFYKETYLGLPLVPLNKGVSYCKYKVWHIWKFMDRNLSQIRSVMVVSVSLLA